LPALANSKYIALPSRSFCDSKRRYLDTYSIDELGKMDKTPHDPNPFTNPTGPAGFMLNPEYESSSENSEFEEFDEDNIPISRILPMPDDQLVEEVRDELKFELPEPDMATFTQHLEGSEDPKKLFETPWGPLGPRDKRMVMYPRLPKFSVEYDFWTALRELSDEELIRAVDDGLPKLAREKYDVRKPRVYNPPPVPAPRDGMTLEKFLKTIARDAPKYQETIGTWENLFNWRGEDFRKHKIPIKTRRWIMRWTEHYRQGIEPKYVPIRSKAQKNRNKYNLPKRLTPNSKLFAKDVKGYNGYLLYLKRQLAENHRVLRATDREPIAVRQRKRREMKERRRQIKEKLAEYTDI